MLTVDTKFSAQLNQLLEDALQHKPEVQHQYAIIVPCYNEEKRFAYKEFKSFALAHPEVLLCLVNDGSKDRTLAVLRGLQTECPSNVSVLNMEKNGGKAEAVRHGMLFVHKNFESKLIGFLDADLATVPEEWLQMAKFKETYPQYGAIVGSRIQRLGAAINRDDSRSFASKMIKKIIKTILRANFQDTQCGAKIFQRNLVPFLFKAPFQTPWLFDVEIFLRLQEKFGRTTLQRGVLEYPLLQWTEVGDSRLKLKDTIRIPLQLLGLYHHYHIKSKPKSFYSNQSKKIIIQSV